MGELHWWYLSSWIDLLAAIIFIACEVTH